MEIRLALKLLICTLLMWCGSVAAADQSRDPVHWLEKMSSALRDQNYQGIFSYMRGSTFDTVRIVHHSLEGRETERLFNLNGAVRELFRREDEVHCFHPKIDGVSIEELSDHMVHIGPFSTVFSERVLNAQSLYHLSMHGEDRIAGRVAIKINISPRRDDRYGYHLWLDKETGLLLQSHLIERGRIKEIFQFTHLEIGHVNLVDLASAIDGETVSHQLMLETKELEGKPVWRVSWLPDGFRPVRVVGNRLHFTDGLAAFSVFVDKPGSSPLPELATTVGGTVLITRRLKNAGAQITVVGEVPVQTAKRVAESVEPVIYWGSPSRLLKN